MAVYFTCPYCHTTSEIDPRYAGCRGPCHACGQLVQVPLARTAYRTHPSRLPVILASGLSGGLWAGLVTLVLLTLPEVGSLSMVMSAIVAPEPWDDDYHRLLIGHGVIWCVVTGLVAVMTACLFGILASWGMARQRLDRKRRGATWGCALTTILAMIAAVLTTWLVVAMPSPLMLAARLALVLLSGLLGGLIGAWRSGA